MYVLIDMYKYEKELKNKGFKLICGVDKQEGSWACCTAAVILDEKLRVPRILKLTLQREKLFKK